MLKYIPVIGMEIHVELKTKSKMFCSCQNDLTLGKEANVDICPICTGQPGTLPVPNQEAIKFVQLSGLALNCRLKEKSKFDRKNYFYPDIPKGYQISQYDQPLCEKGDLEIEGKTIGITRIHLEEDTGKSMHPKNADYSLIDFNRSGVPLMELVTEPDLENGKQTRLFCQKLQQIFRYLEISDADMEKGQMRCEVNISLYEKGKDRLSGTKVEVKNINSFKFVEKAIDYEIKRQTEILSAKGGSASGGEKGERVVQETRGFDSVKNITFSQRSKESAHDYRYFPEPDIPPLEFSKEYLEAIRRQLPELPIAKKKRLIEEYNISSDNAEVIVSDKSLAEYFEEVVSEIKEKLNCKEFEVTEDKCLKLAANYIVSELQKHLSKNNEVIKNIKITPENYAELVAIVASGKINSSAAQTVLEEMYRAGGDPSQIIEEKGLLQLDDEDKLNEIIEKVLARNEASVKDYQSGKTNALQFLVGQVMRESKGKANPQVALDLLKKRIG
jgi:aspartyl-tRNA(Asn)/glutamyl-tRNA(Gln) amidotransferase subunit B